MNSQLRNLSFLSLTLAAGERTSRAVTGARLWVLEADGEFLCKVGNRDEVPLNLGYKVEEDFAELSFYNANAYSITINILYGTAEFHDGRFNVVTTRPNQFVVFQEGATRPRGAEYSIAAGGNQAFTDGARDPGTRGRRRAIIVTNNDALAAVKLAVKDWTTPTTWNNCATIQPQRSFILETDADVRIVNPNGAAVSVGVLETFYTA